MEASGFPPRRLLIVEAIPSLRTRLHEHCREAHYATTIVDDADASVRHLCGAPGYDAVLLDVDLPRRDGFWVLDQARQRNVECAFVLLVDQKHLDDRFRAFAAGVDDYVVKPFAMAEVDARIRAVLTSTSHLPSSSANVSTTEGLIVDVTSQTCFCEGTRVPLSPREFELLACFVQREGETLSRDQLRKVIWGHTEDVCARTIDRHVATIRAKLEEVPEAPAYLHTVYGKGYEFIDPKSSTSSLYFG